jgi:hypothetical protein
MPSTALKCSTSLAAPSSSWREFQASRVQRRVLERRAMRCSPRARGSPIRYPNCIQRRTLGVERCPVVPDFQTAITTKTQQPQHTRRSGAYSTPHCAEALPTISSERPNVSIGLTPPSSAAWIVRIDASSSVPLHIQPPMAQEPSAMRDAFRAITPLFIRRTIQPSVLPSSCRDANIKTMTYGALCRGHSRTELRPAPLSGDDLRLSDPKFQPPRFSE